MQAEQTLALHFGTGSRLRARRSKGCATCRERKVRCDLARPTCERCRKGFHKCRGYDEPRIFVHACVQPADKKPRPVPRKTPDLSLSPKSDTITPSLSHSLTPSQDVAVRDSLSLPSTISLIAFADEIVIAHLMSQMALRPHDMPSPTITTPSSSDLIPKSQPAPAYVSALSVAKALFGRIHNQHEMLSEAAHLYGQALQRLRDDIESLPTATEGQRLESLWSSLLLGMYEMISTSGEADWLQHSLGVAALTRLAGPHAFQEEGALRLLEANRSLIALGAIVQRKRCFLEQTTWKTVPWALRTQPRSITQLLHDILCDTPGLFEDADLIHVERMRGSPSETAADALESKLIATCRNLSLVNARWDDESQGAYWEAPPNSSSISFDVNGKPFFDSVLMFSEVEVALQHIQFNVLSLLIRSVARTAGITYPLFTTTSTTKLRHVPKQPQHFSDGAEREAIEICRAVDYMSLPQHGCRGPFLLLFPLRVAYGNLQGRPDVREWLQSILESISQVRGFEIGRHLLKLAPATIRGS